jgi:hypothetical protein
MYRHDGHTVRAFFQPTRTTAARLSTPSSLGVNRYMAQKKINEK